MLNLLNLGKCYDRGYHRRLVPDLAFFHEMGRFAFPGVCRDCGDRQEMSGAEWLLLRKTEETHDQRGN